MQLRILNISASSPTKVTCESMWNQLVKNKHFILKVKKYLTMCSSFFPRLARCPARVPAWAFCGGSPQLRGVQLRGRVALP